MLLSQFDYDLPPDLIAQEPAPERDAVAPPGPGSRLRPDRAPDVRRPPRVSPSRRRPRGQRHPGPPGAALRRVRGREVGRGPAGPPGGRPLLGGDGQARQVRPGRVVVFPGLWPSRGDGRHTGHARTPRPPATFGADLGGSWTPTASCRFRRISSGEPRAESREPRIERQSRGSDIVGSRLAARGSIGPRALPDRLRARGWRGGRAHGRTALHPGAPRSHPRSGRPHLSRDAACRSRNLPAGARRGGLAAPDGIGAVHDPGDAPPTR